jgi:hypothetical protein
MGQLIGALLLLAIAIFIVWDSFQKPKSREYMLRQGFTPGKSASDMVLPIMAVVAAGYGYVEYVDGPYNGHRGHRDIGEWLWDSFYSFVGPLGFPLLLWATSAYLVFLTVKRLQRKKASVEAPKDGDFASYVERTARSTYALPESAVISSKPAVGVEISTGTPHEKHQTLEDIVIKGEEPTEEFLKEFISAQEEPPISDEELERQALASGGADGNRKTPE